MYYSDDNRTFLSKIKAIEHQQKTGAQLNFYYYDEIYDKLNWNLEPPLSLKEYYKEQALILREKYDYLVLCFSGGLDSTNILETFYYNNIKLDKIFVVGAFSQDDHSTSDENMNIEAYTSAFPHVEKLGLSSITQKFDYTQYLSNVNNLSLSKYGSEWIDDVGSWFSPHHMFWKDMENYAIPYDMRDKKCAMIFGKEKSKILFENGKLGFRFSDVWFTCYGGSYGNEYCDRVAFYMDPYYPQILLKQVHTLKKAVKILAKNQYIDSNICDKVNKTTHEVIKGEMGGMKNILYDMKHTIFHKSPKNVSRIISTRDTYIKKNINTDIFSLYKSGISSMKKRIGNVHNQKIITSKFYEI